MGSYEIVVRSVVVLPRLGCAYYHNDTATDIWHGLGEQTLVLHPAGSWLGHRSA